MFERSGIKIKNIQLAGKLGQCVCKKAADAFSDFAVRNLCTAYFTLAFGREIIATSNTESGSAILYSDHVQLTHLSR